MSEGTLPAPASLRVPGAAYVLPPLLLVAILFYYPLGLIASQSLAGAGRFGAVLGSALFQNALLHTIEIALAATAGCIALGFSFALVLAFVPFPGARTVSRLIEMQSPEYLGLERRPGVPT